MAFSRWMVVALSAIAVAGCSDPVSSASSEGVSASVTLFEVVVTNETADSISYMVRDEEYAARALLSIGLGGQWYQPGEAVRVRGVDVTEWRRGEAVLVFWWHALERQDGTFEVGPLHSLRVPY